MQFFILLLFALPFALGLYLLLAAAFHVPTYRATKVLLGAVRKNRKAVKNSDAILEELATKLAGVLPINPYRRRRLEATLRSAELSVTAGQYLALAVVKAGLVFLCAIPCLFFPYSLPGICSGGDWHLFFGKWKGREDGCRAAGGD